MEILAIAQALIVANRVPRQELGRYKRFQISVCPPTLPLEIARYIAAQIKRGGFCHAGDKGLAVSRVFGLVRVTNHLGQIAKDDICRRRLRQRAHSRQAVRAHQIICVQNCDPGCANMRQGKIACARWPGIGVHPKRPDARISSQSFSADKAVIRRRIINNDDLDPDAQLSQGRGHRIGQRPASTPGCDDYRDLGCVTPQSVAARL
jgi:hypothetical protein